MSEPIRLDALAIYAEAKAKMVTDVREAREALFLLSYVLTLHCDGRLDGQHPDLWASIAQVVRESGYMPNTHLTPALIDKLARKSPEGMDLLKPRIEEYGKACYEHGRKDASS